VRPHQFDHVLAAAGQVTGRDEFVVIGSQAILGSYDDPPDPSLESIEVDIYSVSDSGDADPETTDKIDGALGDGSQFHLAFGYYAHGVGPETAKAPHGWRQRLVMRRVPARAGSVREVTAWCLEVHDLVLSKCVAGRQRGWEYAKEALKAGLVQSEEVLRRLPDLRLEPDVRTRIETNPRAISSGISGQAVDPASATRGKPNLRRHHRGGRRIE
jgi:hypothetical protein